MRYIRIALFFIVMGGAGTVYILMSADGVNDFNSYVYEVVMQDATGLSERSKVYLAGVVVGKVKEIELTGTEARLKISFLKDVEIRNGARIARKTNSILGTSTLALYPGPESAPLVRPGGMIGTEPSGGDMSAVMGVVQQLGTQVSSLLEEFQKNQMALLTISLETFNSIAQKIDSRADVQLENVSRILEAAALISERTERLLGTSEGDIAGSVTDIRAALADIRAITGEIRAGEGNIGQAIYDDSLYAAFLAAAEQAEAAAERLNETLESINTLAKNADGVVTNAGEIVNRAVGLGISVDTNARYDVISKETRAGASLRLDPVSGDRWYRIGISSAPDGVSSRTVTETTGPGGTINREDKTETKYSIAIDAELARRFGMLTLRGGLLESTAGFGIDVQPWNWIALSGELFHFTSGEAPNLRGTLTFYPFFDPESNRPWNWLYLRGGINDALSGKRDYFFGAGFRFADREVKGLVELAPGIN